MAQNNFFFIFTGSKEEQVEQINATISTLMLLLSTSKSPSMEENLQSRIEMLEEEKEALRNQK